MNRVPASVSRHLEERAGESNQILEPQWLEAQLGAELAKLVRDAVVEEIVAGDDGNRCVPPMLERAEPSEESQSVDERHPEIEDDGVRMAPLGLAKSGFGGDSRVDVVPLEPEHSGERLCHALIIVHDQNRCSCPVRHQSGHLLIVTDQASTVEELTNSVLNLGVLTCRFNGLEALGESDSRAAGPRTTGARSHYPPAADQVPAETRGGHQSRR